MSSSEAQEFTAQLVGRLCVMKAGRTQLGVFAENLPPMNTVALVEAIGDTATEHGLEKVRLALLGGSSPPPRDRKGIDLTMDPLVANRWRNDAEARAGVRLITIALGPAPKLNSLRTALHTVSVKHVREELVRLAYNWLETIERRNFWKALGDRSRDIPTVSLLEYAAMLSALSHRTASLLDAEPMSVYRLGLLRQEALINSKGAVHARKTLLANLKVVRSLKNLSDKNRARLSDVAEDPIHQRVAEAVLRFAVTRAHEDLKDLSLEEVREVLRVKPKVEKGDDDDQGGEDDSTIRPRKIEGDMLAVDLLLSGSRGAKAAAERFARAIEPDGGGDIEADEIKVGHRTVEPQPREGTTQSTALFGALLDEETWGGLVLTPEAPDFVSATKMAAAGDARLIKFNVAEHDHVRGMVARGVDMGMLPRDALDALDEYAAARARLLPARQALLDHPLLALAGSRDLAAAVSDLLRTYAEALGWVKRAADHLINGGSVEPGRRLMARMLSLDLVFVVLLNQV